MLINELNYFRRNYKQNLFIIKNNILGGIFSFPFQFYSQINPVGFFPLEVAVFSRTRLLSKLNGPKTVIFQIAILKWVKTWYRRFCCWLQWSSIFVSEENINSTPYRIQQIKAHTCTHTFYPQKYVKMKIPSQCLYIRDTVWVTN